MKSFTQTTYRQEQGFTLVEMLIASVIFTTVVAISFGLYASTMIQSREGSKHINFIGMAREAEQQILRHIQVGKAVGAYSDGIKITQRDLSVARIEFLDEDNDLSTFEDNLLQYDPDISVGGNEVILCRFVSPLANEPMFQTIATSPTRALFSFHVGELAPSNSVALLPGQGYKGVEVRLSATPRNNRIYF